MISQSITAGMVSGMGGTLNLDKDITNGIMTEEELSSVLPNELFESNDTEELIDTENGTEVNTVENGVEQTVAISILYLFQRGT